MCGRCGGRGGSEAWSHTGWTCYQCGGTGKGEPARNLSTPRNGWQSWSRLRRSAVPLPRPKQRRQRPSVGLPSTPSGRRGVPSSPR
ncbi:hypothetical protein C0073_022335 (plasmid) [Aeromonas veronii]|nr:hypothetical protein C0073_022335 [Aeromonas veronii]